MISAIKQHGIGLATLSKREIVRYLVVAHQTLFPPLVSSTLFLFIFGLSVGSQIQLEPFGGDYLRFIIPGIITMVLISGSYENTSSSLFISRWHNHIQEVLLSPLSYMEMVLGLLVGGLTRGVLVAAGAYGIACLFRPIGIEHPVWLFGFLILIATAFSCAGLIAALWAKDFGMLSIWNTYFITPAVFLGGVFNPIDMLPSKIRFLSWINPMTYLIGGMRYSLLGIEEVPVWVCFGAALVGAMFLFLLTVHLFKIGYRLRT